VHYPDKTTKGFIAAAVGIMFSVDDYNQNVTTAERLVIDNFF
jgi:hypothetical protein